MKHIRFQFMAVLSASALMLSSCDLIGSVDDISPDHVVTDDNYITDAASAQTAINGVYASWRSTGVSYLRYGMFSMAHTETQAMVMGADEFAQENIETNNSNVEAAYTAYYNVINTANTFLVHINKNIPGLSDDKRTEMIAEARCQRALAYLTLLKCFGEYWKQDSPYGVCLFKDELVRENEPRKRSSVAETYQLIGEDLDFAIAHCAQQPTDHYHVSALFAKALKAKMYLAQDDYQNAAKIAEEVIGEAGNDGYNLEEDYATIYSKQFESDEMLFAPYVANPSELYDDVWIGFAPGSLLTKIADGLAPDEETGDGGNSDGDNEEYSSKKKMTTRAGDESEDEEYPVEPGDPDNPDYPEGPDGPTATYDARYDWAYKSEIAMTTGIGKYAKLTADYLSLDTYYFMRLAEVYYIAAEAEARQGEYDKARTYLATVIARAGYDEEYVDGIADEDLLGVILKHKLVDISNENFEEWFDLCRYNRKGGFEGWTEDEKAELPAFRRYLLPIPKTSQGANNLLEQNPEYIE